MRYNSGISRSLVLIPCLFTTSMWAQAMLSFNAPPRDYALPSTALSAAVGDFNGDGNLDIAAIGNTGISFLPGKGNGSFGSAVYTPFANGSYYTLLADDFNHDGILDLASLGQAPDGIVIFLGLGNGRFAQQPVIPIGEAGVNLIAADLNNDGNLDFVVTTAKKVIILLGRGDGSFGSPTATGPSGAYYVRDGDFNNDGILDLGVSTSNTLSILLGNGDGTFRSGASYFVGNFSEDFAIGDLNNDGKLDVLGSGSTIAVLLGNGDGTLEAPNYISGSGPESGSIVAADFNGDGNLDFATVTNIATATMWLGDGSGGFSKTSAVPTGNYPTTLTAGDFNGDGRPDLLTVEAETNFASVLLTGPRGKIEYAATYNSDIPHQPTAAIVSDLNNDGKPDVITVGNGSQVSILMGTGNAVMPLQTAMNISLPGAYAVAVAAGDFNKDGNADLAVVDQLNGSVLLLLGRGDGTFTTGVTLLAGEQPGSIAIGDFNGDGKLDLAVSSEYSLSVLVYLGNGDGTFRPSATYLVPNFPTDIIAGDFNGDGRTDLIVADGVQSPGGAAILLANADGTFKPAVAISGGALFYQGVVGDVNKDGKLDVIFTNNEGVFYEYLGNGDGTFQSYLFAAGSLNLQNLSLVDLNGDGNLDLVSGSFSSSSFSILLGAGNGRFSREIIYGAGQAPRVMVVADFNGDGKPDLISLQLDKLEDSGGTLVTSSTYTVLLNTTP